MQLTVAINGQVGVRRRGKVGAWSARNHLRLREIRCLGSISLDPLTQVGTQCERAVLVQLLVASPPYGIAHSLDLNLGLEFQPFPISNIRKHEPRLANLARYWVTGVETAALQHLPVLVLDG